MGYLSQMGCRETPTCELEKKAIVQLLEKLLDPPFTPQLLL